MASCVPRQVANPMVSTATYVQAIKGHMGNTYLSKFFVPEKLVTRPSHVTPDCVIKIAPILDAFVTAGLDNMTFLAKRFEEALEEIMKDDDHPVGMCRSTFVGQIVNHFQVVMKFIRTMKYEDTCAKMIRKCRETDSFRNKLSGADSIVVSGIFRRIKVSSADAASGSEPAHSPQPESARAPSPPPMASRASSPPRAPGATAFGGAPPLAPSPSTGFKENFGKPTRRRPLRASFLESSDGESEKGIEEADAAEHAIASLTDLVAGAAAKASSTFEPEAPANPLETAEPLEDDDYDDNGLLKASVGATKVRALIPNPEKRKNQVLRTSRRRRMRRPAAASGAGPAAQEQAEESEEPPRPDSVLRRPAAMTPPPKSPKPDAGRGAAKGEVDAFSAPLERSALVGPTAEEKPRYELCAFIAHGGRQERVRVWSSNETAYGPTLGDHVRQIAQEIDTNRISKKQCLEIRDNLKA